MNGRPLIPPPVNEPVLNYAPGSAEKKALKARLAEMKSREVDIPLFIGGKEVRTGKTVECRSPHEHGRLLGRYHKGGPKEYKAAIDAAVRARRDWAAMPFHARAAIFLRAAELLANDWRWTLNAATMLCQSKTAHQAEIDAACELVDFYRFNVKFAEQIYDQQPQSSRGTWNYLEQRPLEGFVFAVTPFNFTSIAGNLPTAPAIMGNTVVWKPASSTTYTAHYLMELWRAAGLPPGVINLVQGSASELSETVLSHRDFAGLHFTGSTGVFNGIWKKVGDTVGAYRTYPRLVGETGGKDFVVVHPSADLDAVATGLIRGAFEYQGQKCSAASRAYVPDSLWPKLKKRMADELATVRMGSPEDFRNFFCAVIDRNAFESIKAYIDHARKAKDESRIVIGGKCDDSKGYFIEPTVIEAKKPDARTLCEEIFGPVLTVYVYPQKRWQETLRICDRTSPYALTGAVFAHDRQAIETARETLVNAAGNFYINDKPTGAVVGQQPFGGARSSGTNDKAGSLVNLLRWVSPRTVKENLDPPRDYRYPFLSEA
ncbi:MAG: L-glutamate gamma-semialdehyde dehydrogenase [Elusimicrobia bacterium]|nr:L-glutamate gamma-semialdehyde dehydrogenase [Elusimicrobiota bacterium]